MHCLKLFISRDILLPIKLIEIRFNQLIMSKLMLVIFAITLIGCNSSIKNENVKIEIEEGTRLDSSSDKMESGATFNDEIISKEQEFWVGYFDPHKEIDLKGKAIYADEGLIWERRNKISISIDSIMGDSVIGHSVVAGNNRPFYGKKYSKNGNEEYIVNEPGDHKYDGRFKFKIIDNKLIGTWEAFKAIEIPKREYRLDQKTFKYDPNIMLERNGRYGDWTKYVDRGTQVEVFDEGTPYEETFEWELKEYASSTNKIYEINASTTLLTKADVENLTNSDLVVIRNTIYARHGYSFKNRPLRVFFDQQDWYIPVHADIKQDFTAIEKQNIQLLLRFEKNAKEYYDYFGRG